MQDLAPMRVGGAAQQCAVTTPKHADDASRTVTELPADQNRGALEGEIGPVIGLVIGALVGTVIWILFGVAICTCLKLLPG